jgi:hypothetical protein
MRLPAIPSVSELLRIYRVSAKQNLSQNFLLDVNVAGLKSNDELTAMNVELHEIY